MIRRIKTVLKNRKIYGFCKKIKIFGWKKDVVSFGDTSFTMNKINLQYRDCGVACEHIPVYLINDLEENKGFMITKDFDLISFCYTKNNKTHGLEYVENGIILKEIELNYKWKGFKLI